MKAFRKVIAAALILSLGAFGSALAGSTTSIVPPSSAASLGTLSLNDGIGTTVAPSAVGVYAIPTNSNSLVPNANCTASGFGKYGSDVIAQACCSGAAAGTCVVPSTAEAGQTLVDKLESVGWSLASKGNPIPGTFAVTTNGTQLTTGTTQAQTGVTITGLTTTSVCVCQPATTPATWQTGIQLNCVPTTNTATCQEVNPTAGSITPAAISLNVVGFY